MPASAAPFGSTTITLSVNGLPAVATQALCRPIKSSDGYAVNDFESLTDRFDTSVVCISTRYDIGYGRSAATGTDNALAPFASIVLLVCKTSLVVLGAWSGQNHCGPNV